MKRTMIAGLIVLLVAPAALAGGPLNLNSGTMSLGGSTSFDIDMQIPKEGDSVMGFELNVEPTIGYFMMNNLELVGMLDFTKGFGDLYENSGMLFGIGAGLNYYIPMDSFALHFGLTVGLIMNIPKEGDSTKFLGISVPIGLLFPLNEWVGLDMGVRINYSMGLDDQGSMLNVPIGYLGVASHF